MQIDNHKVFGLSVDFVIISAGLMSFAYMLYCWFSEAGVS
jgi:hypothetical protein